jgi:hypothetical protein
MDCHEERGEGVWVWVRESKKTQDPAQEGASNCLDGHAGEIKGAGSLFSPQCPPLPVRKTLDILLFAFGMKFIGGR